MIPPGNNNTIHKEANYARHACRLLEAWSCDTSTMMSSISTQTKTGRYNGMITLGIRIQSGMQQHYTTRDQRHSRQTRIWDDESLAPWIAEDRRTIIPRYVSGNKGFLNRQSTHVRKRILPPFQKGCHFFVSI